MRVRSVILAVVGILFSLLVIGGGVARAETLSWNAVTTYTDGTPIAPATVNYTAYWTTDPALATGLTVIGVPTTSTSVAFDPTTAGMPRGDVVYLTAKATVQGVDSQLAIPFQWPVPLRTPSTPANLRLN